MRKKKLNQGTVKENRTIKQFDEFTYLKITIKMTKEIRME